ncbi:MULTISPECIES: EAL domain-containing protein [unclassified Phenylobacterium]|uniref:EAL domain-containing protein n=1 Tax=unclassified Phenylobacterium TaxID=2640670 RepID=UPI00083B67D0|nr:MULTISPECIES: EAL domain-containing protein [unclassified Phenylobacterium]
MESGSAAPSRPTPGAPSVLQLLAFVFASADMVLEVAKDGRVVFGTGAGGQLVGRQAESLAGDRFLDLIDTADADLIEAVLQDLRPGERRGPFRIGLVGRGGVQPAMLSLFQMPERSGVAAALSLWQPSPAQVQVDAAGLTSREDFETAALSLLKHAEQTGSALHVDLLEFTGLAPALAAMDPEAAETVRRKLAAVLRAASYGGAPAADLGSERFAMLRSGPGGPEALAQRIRELTGPGVEMSSGELALDPASPGESLRAIRYALDRCIEDGPSAAAQGFEAALRQTVADSNRFKDMIREGRFELVYQPVVDLRTRGVHHYEALTRFEGGGGPAATIKLAEELGLVVEFDMTVVRNVAGALRDSPPEVRIAANISAFSLESPGFVEEILHTTAAFPTLRPRLMLEVTESHRLADLAAANAHIQRLRTAGHVVCLDDFGAGSASLDYLRELEADIVKFDGRFVRSLDSRPRDVTLLKRLAELCAELGVATVAEMIETEDTAQRVAGLGVRLGQGWLFGRPGPRPAPPPTQTARRRGANETWT